jgi:phage anti-repressor protein
MTIDITDELINIYENNLNNEGITIGKFVAEKYCNFNQIELGFIDKFWQNAFNDQWMYLSKEMVINDFGYIDKKYMMRDFYKRVLLSNFTVNEDYNEVNKEYITNLMGKIAHQNTIPLQGGINKKYYMISGECYKNLLMLVKTDKGKQIRKYYIKIENLSKKTYNIIALIQHKLNDIKINNLNKDFEEKLKFEKDKNIKLSRFVDRYHELQKNEIIYIACNKAIASENRFKVGGVNSESALDHRLSTYNSALPNDDLMYYAFTYKVNNYRIIEQTLKSLIPNLLDKPQSSKEIYNIYYHDLKELLIFICENINEDFDYIKKNIKCYTDNILSKNYIPPSIEIDEIIISKSGKITKIDISSISQTEIENLISNLTNKYKQENQDETIKWSDLIEYFEKFINKNNRKVLKGCIKNLNFNIKF